MTFPIDAYLARIGLDAPPPATADGLTRLQEAHLTAIAFEAIDPFVGRVPRIDPDGIAEKLIAGGRGGYCFEQNGLFGAALRAFGFDVRPVFGRVYVRIAEGGPRSHLAHLVRVEGRDLLTDVGFGGDTPRHPVPVDGSVSAQLDADFRVVAGRYPGERRLEVREEAGAPFRPLYGLEDERFLAVDLEAANLVCATWERMPFPVNLMLSRYTADGRVTVWNGEISRRTGRARQTGTIVDAAHLAVLLREEFGLAVAPADIAAVARKLGLPR